MSRLNPRLNRGRSRRVRQLRRPSLGLLDRRAQETSRGCRGFGRKSVVRPAEASLRIAAPARTMFGVGALAPTPNPDLKAFHIAMTTGAGERRSSCTTSCQLLKVSGQLPSMKIFEQLTACRARTPALAGTRRHIYMKGLQIRVWSGS